MKDNVKKKRYKSIERLRMGGAIHLELCVDGLSVWAWSVEKTDHCLVEQVAITLESRGALVSVKSSPQWGKFLKVTLPRHLHSVTLVDVNVGEGWEPIQQSLNAYSRNNLLGIRIRLEEYDSDLDHGVYE